MPTKKPFPSSVEIKRMIAAAPTNKIKGLNVDRRAKGALTQI
jgi:hypothetical protein